MDNITKGDFRRVARKKKRKRTRLTILIVIIVLVGLFISPLFSIHNITVTGNTEVSAEDIITASGIAKGQHLTKVDFKSARFKLLKTPYISDAEIKYGFPGSITINVTEKMPVVYYSFADGFVGINVDGIVTDIVQKDEKNLPKAKGITLTSYSIGEKPQVDNTKTNQINALIMVAGELYNCGLSSEVAIINVEEISSVILHTHSGIIVNCGDTSELSYKFSILKEILLVENSIGVVDLSIPGKATYEMT